MAKSEYVVQITGDISDLQKKLSQADGAAKRLSDKDVIITLNYDGNVKGFNKEFERIAKEHPELTVQFQYDINKRQLMKEKQKLETLEAVKIDVDTKSVEKKIASMTENIRSAVNKGQSDTSLKRMIEDLYKYVDSAEKLGKELNRISIDIDLADALGDKGLESAFDELFAKFENKSKDFSLLSMTDNINDEISALKSRVSDFTEYMNSLKLKGAKDDGVSAEFKELQDQITIIKGSISEMQGQLNNLSGKAFIDMQNDIINMNLRLNDTLELLQRIQGVDPGSVGSVGNSVIKKTEQTGLEHGFGFNSKTNTVVTDELVGGEEGISSKIMSAAIKEVKGAIDSFLHTHPKLFAAFSDTDIESGFALIKEGITKQVVESMREAMTIDFSKVDPDKADFIVNSIKEEYQDIDEELLNNLSKSVFEDAKNIGNQFIDIQAEGRTGVVADFWKNLRSAFNANIDKMIENYVEGLKLEDLEEPFLAAGESAVGKIEGFDQFETKIKNQFFELISQFNLSSTDAAIAHLNEIAQQKYQEVLLDIFRNPQFLKAGETSAIKLEAVTDFIDWSSIQTSAKEAGEKASEALQQAQRSNSPSKVTEELGKDFADGYAKGIEESIPEVISSVEKLVQAATEKIASRDDTFGAKSSDQIINEGKLDEIITKMRELVELIQKISENSNVGIKFDDNSLDKVLSKLEEVRQTAMINSGNQYFNLDFGQEMYGNVEKIVNSLQKVHELLEKLTDAGKETGDALDKAFDGSTAQEIEKQQQAEKELAEAREKLADSANQDVSGNIKSEADALDPLKKSLLEVIELIDKKTEGFLDEETLVKSSVENEANTINSLMGQLELIKGVLKEISDITKGSHGGLGKGLQNLLDMVSNDDFGKSKDTLFEFKDALKELRDELANMKLPEDNFINQLNQMMSDKGALKNMADIVRNFKNAEKVMGQASGGQSASTDSKQVQNMVDSITSKISGYENFKNKVLTQGEGLPGIKEVAAELDRIIAKLEDAKATVNDTNIDTIRRSVKGLVDDFNKAKASYDNITKTDDVVKNSAVQAELNKLNQFMQKNTGASREWKDQLEECRNELKRMAEQATVLSSDFEPVKAQIQKIEAAMREAGETGISMWDRMKRSLKSQIAQQAAMYLSLQDFIRYARELVQTVTQVDTALTELRKVSDASDTRLAQSFSKSAETAKELGATITNVVNSTADWSRMGYSIDQAEELARVTTLYQNVGDNIDQQTASENLISALQGFQLSADEAESVIDKFNEVANNYAIDAQGIGEALKRSAASFNAAGTDISKATALVTATK